MKTFMVRLEVKVPDDMEETKVATAINMLLEVGFADALATVDDPGLESEEAKSRRLDNLVIIHDKHAKRGKNRSC